MSTAPDTTTKDRRHSTKDKTKFNVGVNRNGANAGVEYAQEFDATNCDGAAKQHVQNQKASNRRKGVAQGAATGFFSGGLVGGGTGAGAGAIIGSVIPGPGTLIGAAVGATIGGIVGAGIFGGVGVAVGAGVGHKLNKSSDD